MSWFHPTHRSASSKVAFLPAALAVAVVLIASPSAIAAQDVGDRVRVFLIDETLIGQVSGMRSDGFQLDMASGISRSVSLAEIRWLERDIATGSNAVPWGTKGLTRGALGGAAIGFLLGLAVGPDCQDQECKFAVSDHARTGARYGLGYAAIGGLLGGTTGLILGSRNARDEWQVIDLEGAPVAFVPMVDLRPVPGRAGRVMLGVRLRF